VVSGRWLRQTHRLIRDDWMPHERPALVLRPSFFDRPPVGPPLAGRLATAAGRGHRTSQSAEARQGRTLLALEAYRLRALGWSIRQIAGHLNIGKTTIGKWLYGCYPTCDLQSFQRSLPRGQAAAFGFPLIREVPGQLVARGPRRRDSEEWLLLNAKEGTP
jgi:hypothetical protein